MKDTSKRRAAGDPLRAELGMYLQDMGRRPLIPHEEQIEQARRLDEARRELVAIARRRGMLRPGRDDGNATRAFRRLVRIVDRLERAAAAGAERSLARDTLRARRLVARIERARDRLVEANLRLVVHVARTCRSNGMPLLEMIQEGNLGLLRAVEKFEHERGHRFSTYAFWWIKQAIDRAVANRKLIRVPAHLESRRRVVGVAVGDLHRSLERQPTPAEIAQHAGLALAEVEESIAVEQRTEPVEVTAPDASRLDLLDRLPDTTSPTADEIVDLRERRERIAALLVRLTPREAEIVRLRFGIDREREHTLEEIGARVHLSRERVRQVIVQTLAKLRTALAPPKIGRCA
jgi:RNA polymerase primary sigma factor